MMDGNEIKKKLEERVEQEKKNLAHLENKLNEEAAQELNNIFDNEEEGKKATEIDNSNRAKAEDVLKKSNWEPSTHLKDEMMKAIKDQSEADYYTAIEDPEIKQKRKLVSYTVSVDTISKIKELSRSKRMNQSRFIEMLVEEYDKKQKGESEVLNASPTGINLLELASKVAEILESKNMIKSQ